MENMEASFSPCFVFFITFTWILRISANVSSGLLIPGSGTTGQWPFYLGRDTVKSLELRILESSLNEH